MNGVWTFPREQNKNFSFSSLGKRKIFCLERLKDNWIWSRKTIKTVTLTCIWRFWRKIIGLSRALFVLSQVPIRNCHGLFCKIEEIVTATFPFSRAFFWLFCHGQLVNFHFTGKIWDFLSRALFQNNGQFFKKCHGQTLKCHR